MCTKCELNLKIHFILQIFRIQFGNFFCARSKEAEEATGEVTEMDAEHVQKKICF